MSHGMILQTTWFLFWNTSRTWPLITISADHSDSKHNYSPLDLLQQPPNGSHFHLCPIRVYLMGQRDVLKYVPDHLTSLLKTLQWHWVIFREKSKCSQWSPKPFQDLSSVPLWTSFPLLFSLASSALTLLVLSDNPGHLSWSWKSALSSLTPFFSFLFWPSPPTQLILSSSFGECLETYHTASLSFNRDSPSPQPPRYCTVVWFNNSVCNM